MTIERPKISVCMATFQGENFVAAQLRSILDQLAVTDEVVIVDDNSSDATCSVIRAFADGRVRLIERATNQGPARTFQEALMLASGAIVFLSDQDDLWEPEKVSTMLEAFKVDSEVAMVVSDASLIDEAGKFVGVSYYDVRGKFRSGVVSNVIRCSYLGCTMAFRSELIAKALPIPTENEILHDIWFGLVNSITAGGTAYVQKPLVRYRRHPRAVTSADLSRLKQLRIRAQLLRAIVKFWIRHRFG
jgi:glycosyltransferase involved in cell wall biosynthesis